MKVFKSLFLLLLFPLLSFSQIQGEGEIYLQGDLLNPTFKGGGMDKFGQFVNENFDYTKVTKSGVLECSFVVDDLGKVTNIKITKILDMDSAKELMRVLAICPKWEPASRGGKPISITIKYPMIFKERVQKNKTAVIDDEKLNPESNVETNNDTIYESAVIETRPIFVGGMKKFYQYIAKNYNVPELNSLKGKIIVNFVVEKDGTLTDIKVVKDLGVGTGEEAIRVLKKCPKWHPGMQNNKPVRVSYSLPISINTK